VGFGFVIWDQTKKGYSVRYIRGKTDNIQLRGSMIGRNFIAKNAKNFSEHNEKMS